MDVMGKLANAFGDGSKSIGPKQVNCNGAEDRKIGERMTCT